MANDDSDDRRRDKQAAARRAAQAAPNPAAPSPNSPTPQVMGKISASPSMSTSMTPSDLIKAQEAKAQRESTMQGFNDLQEAATTDPSSLVASPEVSNIDHNAAGTNIGSSVGQLGSATQVSAPNTMEVSSVTASKSGDKVQSAIEDVSTIQGRIKENAIARAQTTDPNELAQLLNC